MWTQIRVCSGSTLFASKVLYLILVMLGKYLQLTKFSDAFFLGALRVKSFLFIPLTLCLLMSSADNLCKQFGCRSGPTLIWYSRKNFLKELIFEKKSADDKNHEKLLSRQRVMCPSLTTERSKSKKCKLYCSQIPVFKIASVAASRLV